MSKHAPIEIIRAMAPHGDLHLGNLAKTRVLRFRAVLAAAAARFQPGAEYTEAGVNEVLRRFLAGAGSMLASDHVELRRWLVDNGLLVRDGFGRRYLRAVAPQAFAPMLEAFAGVDLDAVVAEARAAHLIERAARRAKWEAQQRGPG